MYKRNRLHECAYLAFQIIGLFAFVVLIGTDWDSVFPVVGL